MFKQHYQTICLYQYRIMIANQSKIRPDLRLRLFNLLYLSKGNCVLEDNEDSHKARYLITLNAQANLESTLAKICQLFTDTIYEVKGDLKAMENIASIRFNLFFEFLVKLYHLQDSFLPNTSKETEASLVSQSEIIKDLSYNFRSNEQIKVDFREFNVNCKKYVQQQLRKQSKNEQIFIRLKKVRRKLMQVCKTNILSIDSDSQQTRKRRRYYIPLQMQNNSQLFISKTIQTLTNLRFTKKKYRILQFQNYIDKYRHFFQTKRVNEEPSQIVKKFTIRRYSNLKINSDLSPDQMLINIENLIRVRKKEDINDAENIQIVKMLGSELVRHKKITGCYYPILSPKYVMFNQLSLQTQLSYYPPILQGLGFLKRPCSIEQTIALKGSPQPFDQFAAPNEFILESQDPQNEIGEEVFYNYLYGIDALLQKDEQKNKKGRGKNLIVRRANRKTMSQIRQEQHQHSQTWRYVMVSSYILNSKVFSKESVTNAAAFKQFLKNQRNFIEKDTEGFVLNALGGKFAKHLQRQNLKNEKKLTMFIFDNFIDKDRVIPHETSDFKKMIDFIIGRNGIMADITQLLKKDQKQKYIKLDKYFALLLSFYLNAYEYLSNIKMILSLALKDIAEVKKILENSEISKILSFKDRNKGSIKSIEKSWQSLSSVKEKSKDKKHRLYSIYERYKKIFSQIDEIRKKCYFCYQRIKKQYQFGFTQENHSSYQRIRAEINPSIVFCLQTILQICQRETLYKLKEQDAKQLDNYIISLSLNLKIKYFLFHTTQNSINLSPVLQNLYLDINTQDKKRTTELLEYCLSILSQQEKNIAQLREEKLNH